MSRYWLLKHLGQNFEKIHNGGRLILSMELTEKMFSPEITSITKVIFQLAVLRVSVSIRMH